VVREAIVSLLPTHGGWCYGNTHPATAEVADHIAAHAAKQLATAGARLSDDDELTLRGIRGLVSCTAGSCINLEPYATWLALLNRLIDRSAP
jgi:hypothetical protein